MNCTGMYIMHNNLRHFQLRQFNFYWLQNLKGVMLIVLHLKQNVYIQFRKHSLQCFCLRQLYSTFQTYMYINLMILYVQYIIYCTCAVTCACVCVRRRLI